MQHRPPDFFLGSSEHRGEWAKARSCWIVGPKSIKNELDCVLIEITPPVVGQMFGLGENNIDKLILTRRWDGGLPAAANTATPVLIYRILNSQVLRERVLRDSDVKLTAWGEIYSTLKAAEEAGGRAE